MAHIAQDSLANIYFTFTWQSSHAKHVERYLAREVSFVRDMLPLGVKSRMLGLKQGDSVSLDMDPSEIPPFKPGKILDMPVARFQPPAIHGRLIKPRIGRFYPKNFIASVPGTRPDSDTPFRVVGVNTGGFKADLNHPMAGREVAIKAQVQSIADSCGIVRSGMKRWPEIMLSGAGMQTRLPESPTDFLGADPFRRDDESDDTAFYATPRRHGLDSRAKKNISRIYGELLRENDTVLDLSAGQSSYIPEGLTVASVTGLGHNEAEMRSNPRLNHTVVHDLNKKPTLPFDDASFDAIICSGGVGYLTKPFEVFEEAARILKPGGVFALAFTNRWFEEKVIHIWSELYEFERMGLVSQIFIRTEKFGDLTTISERGWPRPNDPNDILAEDLPESDPVFAVTAKRI